VAHTRSQTADKDIECWAHVPTEFPNDKTMAKYTFPESKIQNNQKTLRGVKTMEVCSSDASQLTKANILKSSIQISLFPHSIKNN